MRILVLTPHLPSWPPCGGSGLRMRYMLKELSQRGHQIVLFSVSMDPSSHSLDSFKGLCEQVIVHPLPARSRAVSALSSLFSPLSYPGSKFTSSQAKERLNSLLRSEQYDLVWVTPLFMADYLNFSLLQSSVVLLDQHESEELLWQEYIRSGSFLQKVFARLNLRKVEQLQKKFLKNVDVALCVSEMEANFMKSRAPDRMEVWTVPNGVDTEFFHHTVSHKSEPIIMLFGAMGVIRNIDAAAWFAKHIFPKIKRTIPDAQFWIVGSNPDKEVQRLQMINGVVVTGTVEDVRPYYEKARVCIAPYRFGAGTRLKILEAMAMGVPIVATDAGCQGIDVVAGQHVLIANNEIDFASRVIELLRNPQRAQALATAGRALVEQKYDWKQIVGALEQKLQELVT